jgi:lysyl endopeptidase
MKIKLFPVLAAALAVHAGAAFAAASGFRAPALAPQVVALPAPLEKAAEPARDSGGKLKVGEVRALAKAAPVARWAGVEGGYVARVRAVSPTAQGLRVRLDLGAMPGAMELRVQGSGSGPIETMTVDPRLGPEAWTPWTEGDAQLIEVFSRVAPSTEAVAVGAIVHMSASPYAKAAAACTLSTACTTGDPALDAAVAERKRSMMRINFMSGGSAFVCTATLIDTPRRPQPYVLTANHCVDTVPTGNSVTSLWNFEQATCDGTNTQPLQVAGGMQVVFTNYNVDSTLMLMNNPPPATATYSPLDTALQATGARVVSLSHPRGDSARFADGTLDGQSRPSDLPYNMYFVNFTRGMIEGGSSGSGAFIRQADGSLALTGVLSRGPLNDACDSPTKFGLYGRLEAFYPQIAQYIGAASPGADDAPNRPQDVASPISPTPLDLGGQPVNFAGRLDYAGDVDVYRFTIASRTAVTVYTEGSLDLVSTLIDANGVGLEANDDKDQASNNTGITRHLDPGTYYLHVAHWIPTGTGPYNVVVRTDNVDINYTALWYNAAESGWGINLTHQGNIIFGTLFTYDDNGAPMWLVMSRGERQADGSYSGALHRTTGPAFNASPWTAVNATQVGTMRITFAGPNDAVLTYSVNGRTVHKAITKQNFRTPPECTWSAFDRSYENNLTDLWYRAPAESEAGWGVNFTHQENIVFATLFTYAANGQGLWLVMPEGQMDSAGSVTGALYRTSGPRFDAAPWTPVQNTQVGTMTITPSSGNSAQLTYTIDGVTVNKAITRQVFASPMTKCVS